MPAVLFFMYKDVPFSAIIPIFLTTFAVFCVFFNVLILKITKSVNYKMNLQAALRALMPAGIASLCVLGLMGSDISAAGIMTVFTIFSFIFFCSYLLNMVVNLNFLVKYFGFLLFTGYTL
jgi:hypothetical protein